MNLLQHSWSDILLLDHIHQRVHNNLAEDMQLPNSQRFDLLTLALLGATSAADQLYVLTMKLAELKFDTIDYTCLKFLLLLNPGKHRSLAGKLSIPFHLTCARSNLTNLTLLIDTHHITQQKPAA